MADSKLRSLVAGGLALLFAGVFVLALAFSPSAPRPSEDLQVVYIPRKQLQLAAAPQLQSKTFRLINIVPPHSLLTKPECTAACRTNLQTCLKPLEYNDKSEKEHCQYLYQQFCMPNCAKLPWY